MSKDFAWYEAVNRDMLECLRAGYIPWRADNVNRTWPCNASTGRPYLGVNAALLMSLPWENQKWVTKTQAGGKLSKDAEPVTVVTYDPLQVTTEWGPRFTLHTGRMYEVYNTQDIPTPHAWLGVQLNPPPPITVESIITRLSEAGVTLAHGERPMYVPRGDILIMPDDDGTDHWVHSLLHEAVHASGHAQRADRKGLESVLDKAYLAEELVAEIGSMMLMRLVGIKEATPCDAEPFALQWVKLLESDERVFAHSCFKAQRAIDYLTKNPSVVPIKARHT